jgi:GIY-YIG catalytic domain
MFVPYALIDMRDEKPFYIGATNDPLQRYYQHIREAVRNSGSCPAKNARIRELLSLGILPLQRTLEYPGYRTEEEVRIAESYWIHHFLRLNIPLCNEEIPRPFHLKDKAEQHRILERIRRNSTVLLPSERESLVRLLRKQGMSKVDILLQVWNAQPGDNKAWKEASAAFDQMIEQEVP